MPSTPRPTPSVFAGLFVVTLSTLVHEILLTRIFSVTMWYHFAFMAISIAMFGMTVGAIVVYLRPQHFTPERASRALAQSTLLQAVTIVIGFLIHLEIPFVGDGSPRGIALLAASYVVIAVPFVFSGISVAVALTKFPLDVPRLYATDLLGAALGCVALIYLLELAGGATSVLVVAAGVGLGAALFARGVPEAGLRRLTTGAAALLAIAAAGHLVLAARGAPLIEIVDTGSRKTTDYAYERWNSHSRVSVRGNPSKALPAMGWGLSEKTGATKVRVRQLAMAVDTWAATVITAFDGDLEKVRFLRDDVTNVAHYLRRDADVFVVGVGGGRDILSALVFEQASVTGVEINENILYATTEAFGDFAGHLEDHPKVRLHVDEARSFITRSEERFDIIQLSLIDTWAATAAGAFVLSESSLYTVEAWETFLRHLEPRGVLSVSRWYYPTRPGEALRIASLARAALERIGVDAPRDHVIMVKAPKASGMPGRMGNGIATILVSPDPFTGQDLATLGHALERLGFEFVLTPHSAERSEYATILSGDGDLDAFYAGYPLDVTPPTDDRPFFFQMLRVEDFASSLEDDWFDPNATNLQAIRVLGALLLVVSALTALCVVVPLLLTTRRADLSGAAPHLLYFFAIGLGFMFVEISQMQRLMVFLGHPTYALSVVLFTLLLGGGLGSWLSGRLAVEGGPLGGARALGLLVVVLVVFGGVTPWVIDAFAAGSTPVRVLAASSVLLAIGLPMGMPFPIGMRAAASRAEGLTPWLWGINGAASVLCSVLATVVAIAWGIPVAFWLGVLCYAGAFVAHALALPTRARRPHAKPDAAAAA